MTLKSILATRLDALEADNQYLERLALESASMIDDLIDQLRDMELTIERKEEVIRDLSLRLGGFDVYH